MVADLRSVVGMGSPCSEMFGLGVDGLSGSWLDKCMTTTKIIHGNDNHTGGTGEATITIWMDDDCDFITDAATIERAEEMANMAGLTLRVETPDGATTWTA